MNSTYKDCLIHSTVINGKISCHLVLLYFQQLVTNIKLFCETKVVQSLKETMHNHKVITVLISIIDKFNPFPLSHWPLSSLQYTFVDYSDLLSCEVYSFASLEQRLKNVNYILVRIHCAKNIYINCDYIEAVLWKKIIISL